MCGTSSRPYPLLQSIDESKMSSSLHLPCLCFATHLCSLLPLCSSLHHTDEKPSLLLPQAIGHRVAHAPPSSLSEAALKPLLHVSLKRRTPSAPIDAKHRRCQPSIAVLWANHRRRVAHPSFELLTDPANPVSDEFLGPSPSSVFGRAPPSWKRPVQ
jgi:hypothetical protein